MNTPWIGAMVVLLALVLTRFSGASDKKAAYQALKMQAA
jgi:DHA1 family inner membrane transport protein